jgi:hypothetical protein
MFPETAFAWQRTRASSANDFDIFGIQEGPTPSQQVLQRHTGEIEPCLIKEFEVAIQPRCMEKHRGRVDNLAKKWALIVNRDRVVVRHSGHGKPSREPEEPTSHHPPLPKSFENPRAPPNSAESGLLVNGGVKEATGEEGKGATYKDEVPVYSPP